MKKKHLQPLTPAALYARGFSDRQDVDLSVAAQLRALKEYAWANGYSVAREYVDEAESGRVAGGRACAVADLSELGGPGPVRVLHGHHGHIRGYVGLLASDGKEG